MDKDKFDLAASLAAIEHVLAYVGRVAALSAGLSPEQLAQARENARKTLLLETWPGVDPALADHLSGEIADRVENLISEIERQVKVARSQAGLD